MPQPKAGGSFATTAYRRFVRPVAVETVDARAGMDIGNTLIGMHLVPVAVPVRLEIKAIGEAPWCLPGRGPNLSAAPGRYTMKRCCKPTTNEEDGCRNERDTD